MNTPVQEKNTYAIDATHSTIEFVVRHMMFTKVRGRFGAFEGSIEAEPSGLPVAVSVRMQAASIDTNEAQRDAHLKSPDFFDAEQFPELTFESRRVEGTPQAFRITGDLTIHGVTREVELSGSFEGRGTDPWGGQRAGYSAHTTIDRKDFGLQWNQALETGGVLVSDEVRIELNVEAVAK